MRDIKEKALSEPLVPIALFRTEQPIHCFLMDTLIVLQRTTFSLLESKLFRLEPTTESTWTRYMNGPPSGRKPYPPLNARPSDHQVMSRSISKAQLSTSSYQPLLPKLLPHCNEWAAWYQYQLISSIPTHHSIRVLNDYFFGPRKGTSLIDRKKDHAK